MARSLLIALLLAARAAAEWPAPGVVRHDSTWVLLTWTATAVESASTQATYYRVERSESGGGFALAGVAYPGTDIGLTDTRAFWDRALTAGQVYTYRVVAVALTSSVYYDPAACRNDEAGCLAAAESSAVYSETVSATTMSGGERFGTVFAESGDGWVSLSWTSDPFPGEVGVSIYRIYRGTRSDAVDWTLSEARSTDRFLDRGVSNLQPYCYMFFPCCPERAPSFVVATPFRPARGHGVPTARTNAAAGPRGVKVNWDWRAEWDAPAAEGYPVVEFALFRSDDGGSSFFELPHRVPVQPAVVTYEYDDFVPQYGQRYFYVIRPVDSAGNLGLAYRTVTIDVELPANRIFMNRNAFRPRENESVDVAFQITEPGRVRISVFTLTGELVRRLYDRRHDGAFTPDAPYNSLDSGLPAADTRWDGSNDSGELVGSGAYFVVLEINKQRDIRSVAVIR